MSRTRVRVVGGLAAAAAMVASTTLYTGTANADPADPGAPHETADASGDVRTVGPDYNQGKELNLSKQGRADLAVSGRTARRAAAAAQAVEGETKTWLALNDVTGQIGLKDYVLRGIGDHIQVWVAQDTAFPDGDCRNDLGLAEITDGQVDNFVTEFDTNIYPAESATFSTPPDRDGSEAPLAELIGVPADYWQVEADQADDIVVLVDNVKDANFYDPSTPDGQTYIAGFFYSVFNEYMNRNIMTIDAYDWLHRTGATPPDDSAEAEYIACAAEQGSNRPYGVARPHMYEGTFAHEYQHLLEYYEDPDEESWVNEGLSDWAQTLVGYVDPSLPPDDPAADGHLSCFQGFADPAFGGPENSLTEWGDQGGPEILCDYGAAYAFMEYLHSHWGTRFMTALHRHDGNGFAGLNAVLKQFRTGTNAQKVLHDWAAAMALDSVSGRKGPKGGSWWALTIRTLNAKINWSNPQAYDSPGAPPNGSDYVRLRKANGGYLTAKDLSRLTFDGASTLEPLPVEWVESANPPDATSESSTCGDVGTGSGPAALYSGCGPNLDRSIVRQVTVPADDATLTFDALWDIEEGWDFGFVQVSADNGATWSSLSTADTTSEHDPGAVSAVVEQLPGFTGDSGTWRQQSADLSAYAGEDVLVAFRYITDPGVDEAGFWVRDITVGDEAVGSTLDGWKSITQVNPIKVAGFTVQLVGYDTRGKAYVRKIRLNRNFDAAVYGRAFFRKALGARSSVVAAIVTFDDPTESTSQYARYKLRVNGVLQPGG